MIVPLGLVVVGAVGFLIVKGGKKTKCVEAKEEVKVEMKNNATHVEVKTTMAKETDFKEEVVLEVQRPWSRKLVTLEKTVEIRGYPLPKEFKGLWIEILETPRSSVVSSVPDKLLEGTDESEELYLVGRVLISDVKEYKSIEEFNKDASLHMAGDSEFGFREGKPCFGWTVKQAERYDCPKPCPSMQRVVRSIFKTIDYVPAKEDEW
mmetsp:Transcript_7590/g.10249  ORF Transcript_7590/g.10249 Transcript_7590/m.10249 type:complete len:207 (-) Transcript_7590:373-993(-)|eukprot:CAMPEP_0196573616 /NCGR_PEP_ID=MMETSP1081-20130531/3493_1 /TAXON_ID=36882 /ORGANISM="Pyramimonas amylifera, Strain CCMP720" /LENGTH=206 /DNA_ID=CAMNT_0041891391 /DNA_START=97 /DNA_END=714 /DNA_ORIENTATION=-